MPRSSTTALYTRVDNSFSNPIIGTTISPSHADTFFDDVEAAVNAFLATSASSVAIGTGAKTFTVAADIANKVFIAGTFVHIYSRADTADFMFGTVTSYSTSTGALVTDITATGGSGTNTDWNIHQAGARGAVGATGATGPTSGIRQAYSSTTTDADPGAGVFRLNHATPASATEAYLDNADSGGATVSTIFDLFDDSTTTTKGHIRFEKSSDPTVWAQFAVTGSVVDGTGYRKLTLTSGAGSGAFTNTDGFSITFFRSGDKGADGAGTGDVVGPAASVDGEVALYDSTTGKLLKRASATGMAKLTSGVLSAGTAGTDFMKPDTTSALTAGFTATSFDAGSKTTGTFTPAPASGNIQHYTNGGAHTLAPPSSSCTMIIECTNASAGAITTSGFTIVDGDTYSSTGTKKHIFYITKTNSFSHLNVRYVTGT